MPVCNRIWLDCAVLYFVDVCDYDMNNEFSMTFRRCNELVETFGY